MGRQGSPRAALIYAARVVALGLAYVVTGRLGLRLAPADGFATLVWPPAGISLAVLLLGGTRLWPGIAVGALVTTLLAGSPPLVACGFALASTLQALTGIAILRRTPGFGGSFDHFAEVVGLGLAAVASAAGGAALGSASLVLGDVASGSFARTWWMWWTGDVIGDLVVAPLLLTWARGPRPSARAATLAEAAALGASLILCAALVFGYQRERVPGPHFARSYLLLLPLLWAAVRFGARGAATSVFGVAVAAAWGTAVGRGAFAYPDRIDRLTALHLFLATMSLASLSVASVLAEQKAAEQARAWLAAIVESSADAILGKRLDGTISSWNAGAERLYGYTREEAVGRSIAMLVPPERRSELPWLLERLHRGERVEDHETVRVRKDGRKIAVALTLSPIRDGSGAVIGASTIARSLTQSTELLQLACEAAHLGVWYWTPGEDRLVWTPLCRELFGLGPDEEVSYARYLAAVHPGDRERLTRTIARAREDRADFEIEHRVVWPDGSVRWVAGCGRVLCDEAGAPRRLMGTATDVTARKQAEQDLAALLVREQAARAEAQAATQAKDDFLAVLSHELRTPLQAMLGWTLLLRGQLQQVPAAQKGLSALERNVRTQARLIEDLLDVSRIVAGKLRLARERVDLASVVESALESARAAAAEKGLGLEPATLPGCEVVGDPVRLQQVVSNLLTNAVKFTPAGGRVRVTLERDDGTARIVVADTGRGIAPEFLPHVFDRFRQAERTTVHARGGLGLGLAIVQHLVEMQGGAVQAESPGEGRGATFTVTLPLVAAESAAVAPERREPRGQPRAAVDALDGARVLVVDDDPDACDVLTTVLQEAGAEVRAVSSAKAAIDTAASFRPHAMVSDIGMPGEDGYTLIRRVRERESTEGGHLPAVALTAFASHADREQALEAGFDAYLAKPVSPEALASTVADLVAGASRLTRRAS